MDRWKDKLKLRLPALMLLAISLLFWGAYDPYKRMGPALLENPGLTDASRARGDISETNGVFALCVPAPGKTADLRFPLEGATKFTSIRVSGSIATEQVVEGKKSWNSARLLLIQRDANGKWIPGKHGLLSKHGTVPWTEQIQEFEISPTACSAEVVLQQIGLSGTARFRGVIAQPVKIKTSSYWFRSLFASAWVVLALLYFRRCRLDRRKLRVLILLNVIAILYGTLMPGDWIESVAENLKEKVSQTTRNPPASTAVKKEVQAVSAKPSGAPTGEAKRMGQFDVVVGSAHKLGHFALFASLCFLVYCSAWLEKQHPVYYLKVGLDILLFAAISESLQYLTVDRTPGLSDWMTDVYGLITAFFVFLILQALVRIFLKPKPA